MRWRRGVSLVEVMVAATILAVGVGGCLSALALASRIRAASQARERVADVLEERLTWFARRPCAAADTLVRELHPVGVRETWRVARATDAVVLLGEARAVGEGHAGGAWRQPLEVRRPCE